MKAVYPIVMSKDEEGILVYVPDFNINTEGKDYAEAMEMARDAIGLMGVVLEDKGKPIPEPSNIADVKKEEEDDVITLVDIDFVEYRKANDSRAVRRTVSLPSWLNFAADKAGVNVSAILQAALKKELNITDRE